MENKEVFDTLNEIKSLMEKSSKILSLSGISAVLVGVYACIAAVVAYFILGGEGGVSWDLIEFPRLQINSPYRLRLMFIFAAVLLFFCIATVYWFSYKKARRNRQRFVFDRTAQRFLWHFFFPLLIGGVLCLSLIWQQHYGLTSSIMLIFYGIALINASSYTYSNTRYLGYAELFLGLADSFVEGHALLFWTFGFGIFHIVYGIFFYLKFDRHTNRLSTDCEPEE
jgi:heme/copper-type cytochrome/quinol oxidase subunit 2